MRYLKLTTICNSNICPLSVKCLRHNSNYNIVDFQRIEKDDLTEACKYSDNANYLEIKDDNS